MVFGPVSNAVSGEQLFVLREGVGLRPGKSAKDAKLDALGFETLNADSPRTDFGLRRADGRSLCLNGNSLDENKIKAIKIGRQNQQKIADPVAKDRGERPSVCDRHAGKLEKIDLKEAFVVGDQLDLSDASERVLRRDSQIAGGLVGPRIGVVSEAAEEGCDGIRVVQKLNVLGSQL